MGLLNRRSDKQSKSPIEQPRLDRLDPFLADDDLRSAYRALVDGDWPSLEAFLANNPKAWMFRSIVTGDVVGLEPVAFERWVEFQNSPRSRVFLASALLRDAYASSADIAASNVGVATESEEEHFHQQLNIVEEILFEVVQARPAMADPWVVLLASGRGLGVELEELRKRFESAHSRESFRPDACHEYLQSLTKKWRGSNVATMDLAHWIQAESSPDSPARAVLPLAHIEKGVLEEGKDGLFGYLAKREVADELTEGVSNFVAAIPRDTPTEALGVLNAYALALNINDRVTARLMTDVLARIDNRPTNSPWSLLGEDINGVFSEVQADQLRLAGRH